MAKKRGLDYFELDCQVNSKLRLVEAEYGLRGFAIVVKLYQRIYGGNGYYCEFNDDDVLLFLSELGGDSGANRNLIDGVVTASIRRGIFSKELFNKYRILSSRRIQEHYFRSTARREKVEAEKEYLLIEVAQNSNIVYRNAKNVNRNEENVCRNAQSRVEESIGEESRVATEKPAISYPFYLDIFKVLENYNYSLDKNSKELLDKLINTYPEQWIIEAIKRSHSRNKLTIKYVNGILKSWQKKGEIDFDKGGNFANGDIKEISAEGRDVSEYDEYNILF